MEVPLHCVSCTHEGSGSKVSHQHVSMRKCY